MPVYLPVKQVSEKLDYSVDFTDLLGAATISTIDSLTAVQTASGAAASGFVSTTPPPATDATNKKVIFWLEAGTDGVEYKVTVKVTASDGKKVEGHAFINVRD